MISPAHTDWIDKDTVTETAGVSHITVVRTVEHHVWLLDDGERQTMGKYFH